MPLAAGERVGSFEIGALIGEGGIGQVYRARDPKLARDVAIKVLAQALAALDDPRIAQIHHFEETVGRPW